MKLFGLTGGIGMGKSAAAQILAQSGVGVVDTDVLARAVVEPGQPGLREIQDVFGNAVITADGGLNREALARIVFSDRAARLKLEAITHPRIRSLWQQEIERWRAQKMPSACVVIPLLFETNAEQEFDATLCVACSTSTQQQRLRERNWTLEQTGQRIAAQWPVEKKMAKANFVVWNEGSREILAAQLKKILTPAPSKEEQWRLFEENLKETDWGHQPC